MPRVSTTAMPLAKVMSNVWRVAATIANSTPITLPGVLLIALQMMVDPVLTHMNIVTSGVLGDFVTSPAFGLIAVMGSRVVELVEETLRVRTGELRSLNENLNQMLEALYQNYRATLRALAGALEARDFETAGHSDRVVAYSLRLGREIRC